MSYDIYLHGKPCPTCKLLVDPDLPDPTYNLTPIFDLALTGERLPNADVSEISVVLFKHETDRPRGLRLLNERKASDTLECLRKSLERLGEPERQEEFRALEPDNGWGDLKGAVWVIEQLIAAAEECPDHVWEIR